ncbi:serine protease inhibitor ecotin [Acinetobacter calcoaceticus]|uniref:Serine protease inhibitor ecotin n=1 Tax=Acinetobacter calcoaceticus TaxID=471 RepID=A0A4V2R133_ACICA|nr:serine protease inhibitor ecotin [Acinetobacter calcoaceticus]
MKKLLISIMSFGVISSIYAQNLSDVAPYPAAGENENRNVIWLDKVENEDNYKVEIIASKQGLRDCNRASYHTDLNRKYLVGWGNDYFVVGKTDLLMSNAMGCVDPKYLADLPVYFTKSEAVQSYNSQLPIVIYAPKDVRINFKIWKVEKVEPAIISNEKQLPDQVAVTGQDAKYCLQSAADQLVGQSDLDIEKVKALTQASEVEITEDGALVRSNLMKTRLRIYLKPSTKVVAFAKCE